MNEILGNLDSLRSAMDKSEFDAIIAMSPENVPYTSGVGIWTQKVIRDRLALVVWPREGEPTLIVATNELGYVREKSWITDVRAYSQHQDSPIKLLSDVLQEKGLGAGRIGFEPAYLTTDYYLELLETMPEAKFESCEPMLQKVRMIKTDAEIDLLCRAATSTERALMATYSTARPGEKERDLVARLGANILQSGAELPSFLFFTVGPNTGYAHPDPTDIELQPNDVLKADCGGWFSGYFSDIGRTVVVGKATDEQLSIYNRLAEVHRKTSPPWSPERRPTKYSGRTKISIKKQTSSLTCRSPDTAWACTSTRCPCWPITTALLSPPTWYLLSRPGFAGPASRGST